MTAINNTIENALKNTEFEGIEVIPEDTKKALKKESDDSTVSIIRPSFRVKIDNSKTGKFNSNNKERTLTVRVYFFAKDSKKYKIDNLKMQDMLENAFLEDVKVTDTFYMPIISEDGVTSDVVDTVLECSFDLYSIEEIVDTTEYEPMEELHLNLEYEGE